MNKYLLPDGTELSEEELQSRAREQGISVSELINSLGAVDSTDFTANDTQQFFLDKGAALVSTVANIGKGIPDFAEAIVDAGVQTYMDISDQFTDIDYTQEQRDRASRVIEQSIRFDDDFEQLAKLADSYRTKYDKGMLESFQEGDIGAGVDQLISGVVSAVPSLLVSAAPGGLIALGMSEAGASYEELSNESPEKRGGIMLANSIIQGGVEALSERVMLGATNKIGKVIGTQNAVRGIAAKIAGNALGEAFSETAAQEINYGLDSTIGDNRFVDADGNIDTSNIIKRTLETGLISGIVGGGKGIIDQASASRAKKTYNEILTPQSVHTKNNELSEQIIKKRSINTSLKNTEVSNEIEQLEGQLRRNKKIAADVLDTYTDFEKVENLKLTREITDLLAQKKNNNLDQPAVEEIDSLIIKKVNKRDSFFQSKLDDLREKQLEESLSFAEDFKFKLGDELNTKLEIIDEQTAQETQNKFESIVNTLNISESVKKETIENFNKIGGFASGNKIVINKAIAENLGQINVGAHEVLHNIFDSVVNTRSKKEEVINGFKQRLGQKNTKLVEAEMRNSYLKEGQSFEDFKKTDQYFDEFLPLTSDLLTDETIKFEETPFQRLKGFIEGIFRPFGYKKLTFKNSRGVYNFMKSYQKSVRKGKTDKEIQDFVRREKVTNDDINKNIESINNSQKVISKQEQIDSKVGPKDNEGNYTVTKQKWDSGLNNEVLGNIYNDLEILIKSKIPPRQFRQPGFSEQDFVSATTEELIDHIRNFNPEINNSLSGWINSQLGNKIKNVYKKGEVTKQKFEEEITELTDIAQEEEVFEEQKEVVKKEVLFRKNLGIEKGDGLYKKILDSTIKDVNDNFKNYFDPKTSELKPEVWKKLKSTFENQFTVDIKKLMSGGISGGRKAKENFVKFLKENRKDIVNKLPIRDLVALDRKSKTPIFTELVKKQLTPLEARAAKDIGAIKAKTETQSPNLYNKKIPTEKEFLDFFEDASGKRKNSLANSIGVALAFDAYTKVLTDSELSRFSGEEKYNVAVAKIFNEIERDSDTINFKQSGQETLTIGIEGLKNENLEKFRKDFNRIGRAVKDIDSNNDDQSQAAIDKINSFKVSKAVKDIAIKFYENKFLREKFNWGGPLEEVRIVKVINGQNSDFIKAKEHNAFFNKNEPDIVLVVKSKQTGEEKEINLEAKQSLTSLIGSEGLESQYNYKTKKWNTKLRLTNENNTFLEKSVNEESSEIELIVDQFYDFAEDFISKNESLKDKYEKEFGIKIDLNKPASEKTRMKRSIPMKVPQEVIKAFDELIPPRKTSIKNAEYTDINGNKKTVSRLTKTERNVGLDKIQSHYTNNKGNKLSSHIITFSGVGFSIGTDNSLNLKSLSSVTYEHKGVNRSIELNRRLKRDKGKPTKSGFVTIRLRSVNEFDSISKKPNNIKQILDPEINGGIDFSNVKSIEETINFKKSKENIDPFKSLSDQFNTVLEETKNIDASKVYSDRAARVEGRRKGRYKFFVPPSADNFMGLIYGFLGEGKVGEKQKDFFESKLNQPYKKGVAAIESAKQRIVEDYKKIKKKHFGIVDQVKFELKLNKKVPETNFNYDTAMRVYIWNKSGLGPDDMGLTAKEIDTLVKAVESDKKFLNFANDLSSMPSLNKQYPQPSEFWEAESISSDLNTFIDSKRKDFLEEFINNSNEIFSKENLNKIQAIYGNSFRESLEGSLETMKSGRLRKSSISKADSKWLNWLNNSTGAIMFLNIRSAILQTVSSVNYLNWNDNNPIKAAAAFADQKQFWKDFGTLFNSDKLKQRRAGTKINITEAEISGAVSGQDGVNTTKSVIRLLLKKGFFFTQIADSFAIAIGGSSMYRNRINTYLKQGLSKSEAESKAFEDFSAITEETQQSADPAEISAQQRSQVGRIILAFANTPMQYARLSKKAALDLVNRRGDWKTNTSKLFYYVAVQNILFNGLQSALFAVMGLGGDDEEENESEKDKEKREKFLTEKWFSLGNNSVNSLLRGAGLGGAVLAALKDGAIELYKQQTKESDFGKDFYDVLAALASVSPPIGSKISKLNSAFKQYNFYEKDVIDAKGFSYDSPIYQVGGKVVSGFTNIPLDRLANKFRNLNDAYTQNYDLWQKIMLGLGWSSWELGLENQEHELIETNAKDRRRKKGYKKAAATRKRKQKKINEAKKLRPTGVIKTTGVIKRKISGVIK